LLKDLFSLQIFQRHQVIEQNVLDEQVFDVFSERTLLLGGYLLFSSSLKSWTPKDCPNNCLFTAWTCCRLWAPVCLSCYKKICPFSFAQRVWPLSMPDRMSSPSHYRLESLEFCWIEYSGLPEAAPLTVAE
jgi:hypothetical protein